MRAFGQGPTGLLGVLLQYGAASVLNGPKVVYESESFTHRSLGGNGVEERTHLAQRQENNTTIPAPIIASVSQYWEGNDGPWSTFAIQVGKKAQNIRVLPSTASTSTWVAYAEGCSADAPDNCEDSRGGIFNPDNSLTWTPNSIFELGIETNLGVNVFGDFGFDTVTLGWQGSGGPSVEHSIVAGIGDTHFSWLGVLGLNPRPTNFSTLANSPQVSFVQSLKDQNQIPSVSWAYTAGAPYRLNKVFGSLVLGGYDASRFTRPSGSSPDLTFPFYTDIARDLLVGISSIETSNTTSSKSSTTLLKDGIFAFIDSTIPHLWLPESVCEAFESAFGLKWNKTSELYTVNSTQHKILSDLNPSVTFKLSPVLPPKSNDQTVSISFPYSAFGLNLSWPHTDTSSYYFPLKRAANETQYTLGRSFLQEAYLIADYERQNFSVWPCSWDSDINNARAVPIRSLNDTTTTNNSTAGPGSTNNAGSGDKKGLSTGAIAGIAVGIAALVIGLAVGAFLWYRRGKDNRKSFELDDTSRSTDGFGLGSAHHSQKEKPPEELDSHERQELEGQNKFGVLEAPEGTVKYEMEGVVKYEMEGTVKNGMGGTVKHEMEGTTAPFGQRDMNTVYEMDAGGQVSPAILVQPPTAISPAPGSGFPSPVQKPRKPLS